ncbi:peptidase M61 [Fulvivirga lutimaris]|uniref:M61 family metallopeptidase n=1 Tax=Fulvivirga lutimaris TaxID=1819566 RepID=UPI0012BD19C9|nr:peptidase M61 [Fulvivirga lutimaris]MTI39539.1 peptidase M61 [Fulvivirga lutimaris]
MQQRNPLRQHCLLYVIAVLILSTHLNGYAQVQESYDQYRVTIDLVNVVNDRVKVDIKTPKMDTPEVTFIMPKIIPGTYEENNYGRFIHDFKALDKEGNEIDVETASLNEWIIKRADKLHNISYWVDDTFEASDGKKVFEPAGSNIQEGENFLLNFHAVVGYLKGATKRPYNLSITYPEGFEVYTALPIISSANNRHYFNLKNYDYLVDSPIMYSKPNSTNFKVDNMDVMLSIYSPSGRHKANDLKAGVERTIAASREYLADLNQTDRYAILVYLYSEDFKPSSPNVEGALEHRESTVLFLPEKLSSGEIAETINGVVTHEFFHTVIPLSIHSEEIHYFNYLTPKMSKHLWLYEGVTEYIAQMAQLKAGLITQDRLLVRITNKLENSKKFKDDISMVELSEHMLDKQYGNQFFNVYMKGALIGLCLDILIREQSVGEKGIIDLLKSLAVKYGPERPFTDDQLFDVISELTFPEIEEFFNQYVIGSAPIPYNDILAKVGVIYESPSIRKFILIGGQVQYDAQKQLFQVDKFDSKFAKELGLKTKDYLVAYNGEKITLDNVRSLLVEQVAEIKEGESISLTVLRKGKEVELNLKAFYEEVPFKGFAFDKSADEEVIKIRKAWLSAN